MMRVIELSASALIEAITRHVLVATPEGSVDRILRDPIKPPAHHEFASMPLRTASRI